MNRPLAEHESYLSTAAHLALQRPSHPFAALLVDRSTGEVIARGVNSVGRNPMLHGEIVCMTSAAKSFTVFDWTNTILYTTAEPCCMCMGAILWAGISEVVFGTSIETLTNLGWNQFTLNSQDVANAAPFADCRVTGRILKGRCDALFEVAAEMRRAK